MPHYTYRPKRGLYAVSPYYQALQIDRTTGRAVGTVPALTSIANDFTAARIAEAYSLDVGWAGAATLNDARLSGRCGGGGCNAPSCAYQAWDIALLCNEQNLQAYMFQCPRFVWAASRLTRLYMQPPEPFDAATNQSIADKAFAWGTWLDEVYKAIGLLRWSANVRWELVTSKIKLPFEWGLQPYLQPQASPHPFWGVGSTSELTTDGLLARFVAELRPGETVAAPTLLMESPLTWAYQQAGYGYHPDCRPWLNSGDIDNGGEARALAWPLRVPQSATDFSPHYGLWNNYATPTMPAMPVYSAEGRRIAYEYQCGWGSPRWDLYRGWMDNQPVNLQGAASSAFRIDTFTRFLASGRRTDAAGGMRPDQLAMRWPVGTSATPLMQVLVAKERCAAYMGLKFGDVVSGGLTAWSEMILALPEDQRAGLDPRTLEAMSQQMGQRQLNEAASYVEAGFALATSLATAVIPQPYGAIVGAVIAVIGIITSALIRSAYDTGLARPDRPPCPAPPLLRNISESTCDFDTAREGVEDVLGKSVVVADLASRTDDVGAWYSALQALDREPMEDTPPDLPPPDRTPEPRGFPWLPIVGGSAVGLLLAFALRKP